MIADIFMFPIQVLLFLFSFYFCVLGFFGMFGRKELVKNSPRSTFAILIPAHNESAVVANLVKNLIHNMNYPRRLYDIFVIADNCTDNTALVAKAAGANVFIRRSPLRSKGYAMGYFFDMLKKLPRSYDAVVVFDADNLVDSNFLNVMNDHLLKGENIIQGFLDSKNPYDTWVSGTFAIAFWLVDYLVHKAKYNLGLSAVLGGTGMCIRTSVIENIDWRCNCLTEDMEFTMRALTYGIKTTFASSAIVYDEKPLTFMQSYRQRKRWAQGQFDVAARFIPQLLKKYSEDIRKVYILDGCIYLLQPYILMITAIFLVLSQIVPYTKFVLPESIVTLICVSQYVLPVIILIRVRAKILSWLYIFLYPLFSFSWLAIIFDGYRARKQTEWVHTLHSRSIGYGGLSATR